MLTINRKARNKDVEPKKMEYGGGAFYVKPLFPGDFKKFGMEVKVNKDGELIYKGSIPHFGLKDVIPKWEDVQDTDGNPISCTADNINMLFELIPMLEDMVIMTAWGYANKLAMDKDDQVKNSSTSSDSD